MTKPPLVADEIANKQFPIARRGFDPDEVRRYLSSLAEAARQQANELLQSRDQLALGTRDARREDELEAQLHTLRAQLTDLGNRLTLSNAVRQEAMARAAELEAALADKPPAPAGAPAATPGPGDDLDRASNELAQVLREAKIRAAHIKADAEREAALLLEQTRRDSERARTQQQLLAEQAGIRLQERLAELCREAESRVVAANTEAARVLAQADESAARTIEHATFQARRLVANAGSFTAIWVAEADELRNSFGDGTPPVEHATLLTGHSVNDALAAFSKTLEADDEASQSDADESDDDGAEEHDLTPAGDGEAPQHEAAQQDAGQRAGDEAGARSTHLSAVDNPAELLHQADQLLSIAEVVRRADPRTEQPDQAG
ncbi:DivIVA domain-containing protein [Jatrophihabitans sp.]|uniref:DivIVA domain-containing protein n=1 Tax=Jatrophihabitans sp. TaxID=1932789 RepID=UPI0030C6AC5B|nr:hypothetical protein [Jatrophihabitans sp.]